MAAMEQPLDGEPMDDAPPRRWWRWLILILVLIPLLLAILVPAGLWYLAETPGGRAFVARQIAGITPKSGLRFSVGRLDGSLLSRFSLHDVRVNDLDGNFAIIPQAEVTWRPITLVNRTVSLDTLTVPEARLLRVPRTNPSDPNEPLLPDIDIHVGRFDVSRLILEKAVAGTAETVSALGKVEIRSGRLFLDTQAATQSGDKLALLLDAEPDADKFDLKANARAPAGGFVSRVSGFGHGLSLEASGVGTWKRWRGQMVTDLLPAKASANAGAQSERLADLAIMADNGRFRVQGSLLPASLLPASVKGLTTPAVKIDASVSRQGDVFAFRIDAGSDAVALLGGGGIDVKQNLLHNIRIEANLLRPDLVDPRLSGQALQIAVTGDGPIDTTPVSWAARANRLRFVEKGQQPMGADNVALSGQMLLPLGDKPISTSFTGSAGNIVGLPEAVAGLAANPRISGAAAYKDGAIAVSGMKLRTDALTAAGNVTMAPSGRLNAKLTADIPRYAMEGLGVVAASANFTAMTSANGSLSASGSFQGKAVSLTNDGVRNFLGGLPTVSGRFGASPDGSITATNIDLRSPKLNFTKASAAYNPDAGTFRLDAHGRSADYGPIGIVASGTPTRPRATVTLASPGFGVGLRDVVADVTPTATGFAIVARGASPQGPLTGDAHVALGNGGPMVVDLNRVAFAGITGGGRLTETAAGPFGGTLRFDGRGLNADVQLSAEGKLQRIGVVATARNARLPLEPLVAITSGAAKFDVVMVPDHPTIVGNFGLRGVRRGNLVLNSADGVFDLKGATGNGRVRLIGKMGRQGKDFDTAIGVRSVTDGYLIALSGTVDQKPLRLERPAHLTRANGGWELQSARLVLPAGQVEVGGAWGRERRVRMSFEKVDLAVIDWFGMNLGLGGTATGALDLQLVRGAPIPQGQVNVRVDKLTRASLTGVSVPVDLVLAGTASGDGMTLGGRITMQDRDLGRLVVRVAPGRGEDMVDRFMNGGLAGGIRYNGPSEPLWALVAPEGQELKGPIAIGADFAGTVEAPEFNGVIRASGLAYHNALYGTRITDIALNGRFEGPYVRIDSLTGKAGNGTLSGSGEVNLSPGDNRRVALRMEMKKAQLARSDLVDATISGQLGLDGQGNTMRLSGDLNVDSARVQVVQMDTSEVPVLKVRRAGEVAVPAPEETALIANTELALRIRANDSVRVEGMGLDSTWNADIRIRGTASAPIILGRATLSKGSFTFASSDFEITSGLVAFNGKPMESTINIQATTTAQEVTATATISGTAARPQISFSSTPSLPEDEILSRLLFGTSVADLSVTEAVQLASAVAGLRSGMDTMTRIRRGIGLDRLKFVGDNKQTGMSTGLAVGKKLTKNIYIEVLTDSQGRTLTTVQWTLSRIWSLIGEVSSLGQNSVNARYLREY